MIEGFTLGERIKDNEVRKYLDPEYKGYGERYKPEDMAKEFLEGVARKECSKNIIRRLMKKYKKSYDTIYRIIRPHIIKARRSKAV